MINWAATFIIVVGIVAVIIGWQGTYKNIVGIATGNLPNKPCPPGTFNVNGQCVQSIFSQWIQQQHGATV